MHKREPNAAYLLCLLIQLHHLLQSKRIQVDIKSKYWVNVQFPMPILTISYPLLKMTKLLRSLKLLAEFKRVRLQGRL